MDAGMDGSLDLDDMDDMGGGGGGSVRNDNGPRISPDESQPKYTVETLAIAVAAGSLAALFLGFVLGYCCGRKCRKNEEDNMPYPDTEYEYFEQRQNCHMRRYDYPSIPELLFSAIF
jgi:semaphorin 6